MPDRIVRQRILTSEKVEQLDHATEVFYRRLLNVVDDFGRFDARPAIIRAACYPLRIDRTREADCTRWLATCQKAGLIALYEVDGKPYLELLNLADRRRAKHSKYPAPSPRSADMCQHVPTHVGGRQDVPPYSDSESDAHSDAKGSASADRAPPKTVNAQQRLGEKYKSLWTGLYSEAGCCVLGKEHYAMLARIVSSIGEVRAELALERFIADRSEFVVGTRHALEIFVKRVNQYNAGAAPPVGGNGTPPVRQSITHSVKLGRD